MIINKWLFFLTIWLYCFGVLFCSVKSAEKPPVSQELQDALVAAKAVQQIGPVDIPLIDQAVLNLPKGYVFITKSAASNILRTAGIHYHEGFQGLVFEDNGKWETDNDDWDDWAVLIQYVNSGYIKDDDAKTWNVDKLLDNYRKGTEASNKERVQHGSPALEVEGWVEKPVYDESNHRLVWSMSVKHKGDTSNKHSVNYNTYVLGREGFFSLDLVSDINAIDALKPRAHELLAALQFNSGKTYADFNESTDKVAEYGLAALIGGIAAKKLGLLALGVAFFAKFAKLIIAGLALIGTIVGKLMGKKKSSKT